MMVVIMILLYPASAGLHVFHLQAYLLNPASTKTPVGESFARMKVGEETT